MLGGAGHQQLPGPRPVSLALVLSAALAAARSSSTAWTCCCEDPGLWLDFDVPPRERVLAAHGLRFVEQVKPVCAVRAVQGLQWGWACSPARLGPAPSGRYWWLLPTLGLGVGAAAAPGGD